MLKDSQNICDDLKSTVVCRGFLKGLVYHGDYHFTCHVIDKSGNIWFHDGMMTGRSTLKEGKFGSVSQPNLKECRFKQLCLVIYGHKA